MKTLLYNTETQTAGEMRYGPYLVDGQPGPLPDSMVELTVVTHDYPTLTETQTAEPGISVDLENRSYNEIWTVRDLTSAELADLNPVPREVAAWRLRAVTDIAGLTQAIAGFLDSIPDETTKIVTKEAWYNGTTIERNSSTVAAFGQALELSSEQLDDLFKQAAEILA